MEKTFFSWLALGHDSTSSIVAAHEEGITPDTISGLELAQSWLSWSQCYNTFYLGNLRIFRNKLEYLALASLSSLV
jgi:hypothetical protein